MEKKIFTFAFCITMSFPAPSNISKNNADVLEKQQQEMQQRHKEEQQFLLQLEEVAKLHQAECVAQKARREVETKTREEAERKRVVEKEKKKKKTLEYLQQLRDKILEKEAALLESAEESQVTESKHKKVATGDKKGQRPSNKAKGKQQERYHRGAAVKMVVLIPVRGT